MKESFGELYTRLYNENIQELETLREKSKKVYTKFIVLFVLLLIGFMFIPFLSIAIVFGVVIYLIINAVKGKKDKKDSAVYNYKDAFKEKIITPLISNVFENGTYEPERGWSEYEYKKAGYRDDIDRYSSEDMITATIKGNDGEEAIINFAEVHTERRSQDSEGRTTYHTQFYGIAGKMQLKKNISTSIYIRRNGGAGFFNNNKIKMDMSEFEKYFDVEAQDKILAVRILTSDVMSEMIELYKKFKYSFDIHIINNTIYMRMSTGEVFEPNIFKNAMEYKTLEKYYLVLKAMMNISKHIYDIINEIEL